MYFLTFIDYYTRKKWIYLLKHKSKAFSIFKKFKALVEKESGKQIKVLKSDNGSLSWKIPCLMVGWVVVIPLHCNADMLGWVATFMFH